MRPSVYDPLNARNPVKDGLLEALLQIQPNMEPEMAELLAEGLYRRHYAPSTGIGSRTEYSASAA